MVGTATHAPVVNGLRWAQQPVLVAQLASIAVVPQHSLSLASPAATSMRLGAGLHAKASQLASIRLILQCPHLHVRPQTSKASSVPCASSVNAALAVSITTAAQQEADIFPATLTRPAQQTLQGISRSQENSTKSPARALPSQQVQHGHVISFQQAPQ